MTEPLCVADCLCSRLVRVEGMQRYREVVAAMGGTAHVFAVQDEGGDFIGLVQERQAALFPTRIFADLVVRRRPPTVSQETGLEEALQRLQEEKADYLPVVDKEGRLVGAVSQTSVFLGLLNAEQASLQVRETLLQQLREELDNRRIAASVFDATSEGILVTDAKAHILLVNRAFCTTTGYSLEEVQGLTPAILRSGIHDEAYYRQLWGELTDSGSWRGEIWNRRKNGEVYPEWLHINAVRDDKGRAHHYVGVFSDISAHKEVQQRIHRMAYFDPLSGLANRQLFLDRLEQAVARARRTEKSFSLLFIDLDRFKNINDSLGHRFGDQVLTETARRLTGLVRESDTVARLGGDEFTILTEDGDNEGVAARVAEKVLAALVEPIRVGDREVFVGASIGVARYPADGIDAECLLMNADAAMYRAKAEGRSTYRYFTPDMNSRLQHRMNLEENMRHGLAAGQFWIALQPQVRLADGAIVGAEALLRWHHPQMGAIPPGEFIPLAEENGFIIPLGRWVLEQIHDLLPEGVGEGLRLAVNFSPVQFSSETGQDVLRAAERLKHRQLDLEIEITEGALMRRDSVHSSDLLQMLSQAGVALSVDDFGTGYSNLGYIKRLPIRRLKIDQCFVRELEVSHADRQIVTAIVKMAHSLGLQVVAEGVETGGQADFLREVGCDEAQGFFFAHPMPVGDLVRLLAGSQGYSLDPKFLI